MKTCESPIRNILVTGATGFIGSHVVKLLADNGYEVIAAGRTVKKWTPKAVLDRFIRFDIENPDLSGLDSFDAVVHLAAAQNNGGMTWENYYHSNVACVEGLSNLANKCFIYASSGSVYDAFGNENPLGLYGLSKFTAEKLLEINAKKQIRKKSVVLRFPEVFGAQSERGIVYEICKSIVAEKQVELFSKGLPYRNLLYVDSAAKAVLSVIENHHKLECFERFDIGSVDSIRLVDLARHLVKALNSDAEILLSERKSNYDRDFFMEVSKAASKIGFKPEAVLHGVDAYLRESRYEV